MRRDRRNRGEHRRQGMALVGALGLMMLAAGLLAGTAVAAVGLQRATRTLAATGRANAELRRALAGVLQGWDAGLDSMPVGASIERPTSPVIVDGGVRVAASTRIRRLGPTLYAAAVAVSVGDSSVPLASRRARLVVARIVGPSGSGSATGPQSLARWSVTDLP